MATTPEKDLHIDLEAIRSDIAALAEGVGKLANEASNAQTARAKTLKKAAIGATGVGAEVWNGAAQLGHDSAGAAADAAHAGMSNLEKRFRQNPVTAILIALVVGFVVGVVGLKRR